MRISTFFQKVLGANLANTRWSWGATNPTTNQVFLRVWADQLTRVGSVNRILILRDSWEQISPGYSERKRHVEALQNGAEGFGVLCTAKDISTTGGREILTFDDKSLLRFGNLVINGDQVFARVLERVPVETVSRPRTAASTLMADLKSILSKGRNETTKEALANARIGQGTFRAQVLQKWGSQCCATGSTTRDAIRASHIKPWRDSDNSERLDANNGLPLVATLDALFDAGLITFAANGNLLIAQRLGPKERQSLGITGLQLLRRPNHHTARYLAYHRESIFVDAKSRHNNRIHRRTRSG